VAATQPVAYCKLLTLLVPREHKVQHSNAIKNLTDEELDAVIEHLKASLEAQAQTAKVIEGTAEPVALLGSGRPQGPAVRCPTLAVTHGASCWRGWWLRP
jgi:hypothetical protein